MNKESATTTAKYSLDKNGCFHIHNYNHSRPFSNFFPGVAGCWGIPMWVFYVNRGQGIASFGIESKNKSLMEFQPANKAYRLTSTHGFRTFIKVRRGKKVSYWEPFQGHLGSSDPTKQKMSITAHDLTLEDTSDDLGLRVRVNYFTIPEEPFAGLARVVQITNTKNQPCDVEILDGLPAIVPYGQTDWLNKNMCRTVEAWVKVRNVDGHAPYFQLNVEVADTPQVTHIKEGHFYFAFDPKGSDDKPLPVLVEADRVFGASFDFLKPEAFLASSFSLPKDQKTSNKSPCAMSYRAATIPAKRSMETVAMAGYARSLEQLKGIVERSREPGFIDGKARENEALIAGIRQFALTNSENKIFNQYASYTFLDNVLRGGLPVSLKTREGYAAFNVYSRKHGDLERDYNFFYLAPTFFTQGNGNYRDVNQNRRNDVWFNKDVRDGLLINFLNLVQADGYNPLIVKGTSFTLKDRAAAEDVLKKTVTSHHKEILEILTKGFQPGDFLKFIEEEDVGLKVDIKDFLGMMIEVCEKREVAEHGEGFWSDHWTYNLDIIESYLAIYPEERQSLLLDRHDFVFYQNHHYVLPRDQRYILTDRGVRQYHSVYDASKEMPFNHTDGLMRTKQGEGAIYRTNLLVKLLCLLANKVASLDPSGCGVEMEADKPNWYDALNGLPGLLGSSISETLEVKRLASFVLDSIKQCGITDDQEFPVYEELATLISGLSNLLTLEAETLAYWNKSNDVKEHYRKKVRFGIAGAEKQVSVKEIKEFLNGIIAKTTKSVESAKNEQGFLTTYFYHEVSKHDVLDKSQESEHPFVRPKSFIRHDLPLFLEGYVHALRASGEAKDCRELYESVLSSGLYDRKLKMFKVNADLTSETEEIGRTRIFPRGWLENESIWLHMEYKFLLELIRNGLYDEFYESLENCLVCFQDPKRYGRNILENSSFIVSSDHEDPLYHGRGFVARLSGSTAEFIHIWLLMNVGAAPFTLDAKGECQLAFSPVLKGDMFTKKPSKIDVVIDGQKEQFSVPAHTYSFLFLGKTLVVYHNEKHSDTFGKKPAKIKRVEIVFLGDAKPVKINGSVISAPFANRVRERDAKRIDVYFQ